MPSEIPRVLHQIWISDNPIPSKWDKFRKSWTNLNPDWKVVIWDTRTARNFVEKFFPEHLSLYDWYPNNVQRSDMLRCCILLKAGGVFADFDMECLKCFDPILRAGSDFFAGYEKIRKMCNALMGCVPNHPILEGMLKIFPETKDYPRIEGSTGPFVFSRAVREFQTENTKIYPREYFYPFFYNELEKWNDPFPEAYAKHYWSGSWRGKKKEVEYWL